MSGGRREQKLQTQSEGQMRKMQRHTAYFKHICVNLCCTPCSVVQCVYICRFTVYQKQPREVSVSHSLNHWLSIAHCMHMFMYRSNVHVQCTCTFCILSTNTCTYTCTCTYMYMYIVYMYMYIVYMYMYMYVQYIPKVQRSLYSQHNSCSTHSALQLLCTMYMYIVHRTCTYAYIHCTCIHSVHVHHYGKVVMEETYNCRHLPPK